MKILNKISENIEYIFDEILDFFFETKVGHFTFLMIFITIVSLVASLFTTYFYKSIFLAGTLMAIFLSITDENDQII